MILIGLGSNLTGACYESPRAVIDAAVKLMEEKGLQVTAVSPYYESEPFPKSDQPWFVNAVAAVVTDHSPKALLRLLHDIEGSLGRARRIRWEARIIDLDIIAYDEEVLPSKDQWAAQSGSVVPGEIDAGIMVPHPRMQDRLFVLRPLADIAPQWRHPVSGRAVEALMGVLEAGGAQGELRKMT